MTTEEYEHLAKEFRAAAAKLRELRNQLTSIGGSGGLFSADLAASFAEQAARCMDERIENLTIAQIAEEDSCATN